MILFGFFGLRGNCYWIYCWKNFIQGLRHIFAFLISPFSFLLTVSRAKDFDLRLKNEARVGFILNNIYLEDIFNDFPCIDLSLRYFYDVILFFHSYF